MPRFAPLALVLIFTAAGPVAAADTTTMCLDQSGTSEAQCTCATNELKEDIGEEDAELYNAVSVLYLDGKANGQEMGDAWDAAIETVAMQSEMDQTELLERMNAAGKAHKEAITACKDAKAE